MESKINMPHPGVYLKEELEERKWSEKDLANALKCSEEIVKFLILGKHLIDTEVAEELGKVFDVSPEFFTKLQENNE